MSCCQPALNRRLGSYNRCLPLLVLACDIPLLWLSFAAWQYPSIKMKSCSGLPSHLSLTSLNTNTPARTWRLPAGPAAVACSLPLPPTKSSRLRTSCRLIPQTSRYADALPVPIEFEMKLSTSQHATCLSPAQSGHTLEVPERILSLLWEDLAQGELQKGKLRKSPLLSKPVGFHSPFWKEMAQSNTIYHKTKEIRSVGQPTLSFEKIPCPRPKCWGSHSNLGDQYNSHNVGPPLSPLFWWPPGVIPVPYTPLRRAGGWGTPSF